MWKQITNHLIIEFFALSLCELCELRALQLALEVQDLGPNLLHVNLQSDIFF